MSEYYGGSLIIDPNTKTIEVTMCMPVGDVYSILLERVCNEPKLSGIVPMECRRDGYVSIYTMINGWSLINPNRVETGYYKKLELTSENSLYEVRG